MTAGAGLIVFSVGCAKPEKPTSTENTASSPSGRIASRGRIEPLDGVVKVSARSISGQPSIVSELKVKEGDWLKAGQVIAILDSHKQLEAAARDLQTQVAVARLKLAAVKAGGKKTDAAASQAEVARLQAVLANDRKEAQQYEELYSKGSATVTERDQRQLQVETTMQALNAAKAKLAGVDEVRDSDVKLAEAEVLAAQGIAERANAELQAATIRAPFDGRVLKIHAHEGEEVGSQGLVELARTDKMYVIAEVYETDVNRVHAGQSATITSEALPAPLHGTVEFVGMRVSNESLTPADPVSLSDARVVDVKIKLDNSEEASHLIHGQVMAIIEP